MDEFDRKLIIKPNQLYITLVNELRDQPNPTHETCVNVRFCGNIFYIFNFRSCPPINVRLCGNIFYIFGHIHHVNVRRCQFFGHVHQFRSYSFGHLDSAK